MKVNVTLDFLDRQRPITLNISVHQLGRIEVSAVDAADGSPFGDATKKLFGVSLEPNELLVKTYSENSYWVPQLLKLLPDLFEDTGKRVPAGFTELHVWRLLKYAAEKYVSLFKVEFTVDHSEEDSTDIPKGDFFAALRRKLESISGPDSCTEVARYSSEKFYENKGPG